MNEERGQGLLRRMRAVLFLLPALVTAVLVLVMLPRTAPVLMEIPELLVLQTDPAPTEEPTVPTTQETVPPTTAALGDYTDGVYTGSARGYGGDIEVQVTVEGGQITDVDILSSSGETESFFNRAQGVIDLVYLNQTWEVDVISGATYSCKGILGAIENALTGEKVENAAPPSVGPSAPAVQESFTEPAAYKDGTYTGSAQGFGGTITVSVTISGGKLTDLKVVSASGETGSYMDRAMAVVPKILETGSPNVDTVSGATYSSTGIINATKRAMNQAATSEEAKEEVPEETQPTEPTEPQPTQPTEPPVIDPAVMPEKELNDGAYTGIGEGFGGDIEVLVTVEGGRIAKVEILSAEDETPSYFEQAKGILPSILTTQSTQVDTVSGATFSSEGILEAVENALSLAEIMGEETTPAVPTEPAEPTEPVVPTEPAGPTEPVIPTEPAEGTEPTEPTWETEPTAPGEEVTEPGETEPTEPIEPSGYADGTYSATGWCEDEEKYFRYELIVTMMVSGGRITGIDVIRGVDESDYPADNDKYIDYAVNGRERRGVTYPGVPQQIIGKQSADEVDAVSGATYSSNTILELIRQILTQLTQTGGDRE